MENAKLKCKSTTSKRTKMCEWKRGWKKRRKKRNAAARACGKCAITFFFSSFVWKLTNQDNSPFNIKLFPKYPGEVEVPCDFWEVCDWCTYKAPEEMNDRVHISTAPGWGMLRSWGWGRQVTTEWTLNITHSIQVFVTYYTLKKVFSIIL